MRDTGRDAGGDAASVPRPGREGGGGTTWQPVPGRCPCSACPGGRLPPASQAGGAPEEGMQRGRGGRGGGGTACTGLGDAQRKEEGPAQPGRSSLRSSVGTSSMEMLQRNRREGRRRRGETGLLRLLLRLRLLLLLSAQPCRGPGAGAGLRGADRGVPGWGSPGLRGAGAVPQCPCSVHPGLPLECRVPASPWASRLLGAVTGTAHWGFQCLLCLAGFVWVALQDHPPSLS